MYLISDVCSSDLVTWDIAGGQMGYNSLVNIFFFCAGMYISAVVQIGLFTDVGTYTSARGGEQLVLDHGDFFYGLALGMGAAAVGCVILALLLGRVVFGMRGPYFAIGTLGIALAARELRSEEPTSGLPSLMRIS